MIHDIVNSWRLEDRWRDREDHQRKKEKREGTVGRNGDWRSKNLRGGHCYYQNHKGVVCRASLVSQLTLKCDCSPFKQSTHIGVLYRLGITVSSRPYHRLNCIVLTLCSFAVVPVFFRCPARTRWAQFVEILLKLFVVVVFKSPAAINCWWMLNNLIKIDMLSAAREAHWKKCERGFYNAAAEGRVFHVMDRPQANKLFIYFVPFLNHHNSCCLFHAYNTQLVSKSGKLCRSSNSQFID